MFANPPTTVGRRWFIAGMLFLAAVLNYVDKNTLSLLAPTIQADLKLSDRHYANIQNAFQIAYTIALLASGAIVDRLGPRISMALFVGWWSVANVFTSAARSLASLSIFRFLLGLGEAGNWTASPKTVSEWFPPKERGLAIGIYTAGTPIGMTLAPLFIIWLAGVWGWRSTFIVTGLLGLAWLAPWLLIYRTTTPGLAIASPQNCTSTEPGWSWRQALARPEVWCLLIGRMLSDPVWFFYQNWYPKYLVSARELTQTQVKITWIMFLAAGIGSIVGGWLAGRLVRRGFAAPRARLMVMLGCALFMPLSPMVATAASMNLSLAIASVIVLAHLAWLANISALVVDVVPAPSLGTVFGIVAAGSSLGAIAMNDLVARLVKDYSYSIWYVIAAFPHLLVIPLLFWGVLRHKRTVINS